MGGLTLPSGRQIGPGFPTFVVAEIGSNWNTFEDCKSSIAQAKLAGADAVKFQLFDSKALYGMDTAADALALIEKGRRGRLDPAWLPQLREKADAVGIEFMCSAFSPELVDAVNPYVNIHKVASAECTHKRMLEKLRMLGKPVFLSTGAHGAEDIMAAVNVLTGPITDADLQMGEMVERQITEVVLFYCVAAYPAREINLDVIPRMAKDFGLPIGFSDHSTDVLLIPRAAAWMGAAVIEKHVTALPEYDSPDRDHSLTMDEFKRMVGSLALAEGEGANSPGATPAEKSMILRHNRRLIATRDIAEGETLLEVGRYPDHPGNFGIFRSLKDDTHAYHPFMIDHVLAKPALRQIKAGDGIGPGDV